MLSVPDVRLHAFARLVRDGDALRATPFTPEMVRRMVADVDLAPAVPAHVREQFERCRTLHAHGAFAYDLFTVAMRQAAFILEAALGARFLAHFPAGVPLANRKHGGTVTLPVARYDEVDAALRRSGTHPLRAGWYLPGHPNFDGSLNSLLGWARREGLLHGGRNRVREEALRRMRNQAAHLHGSLTVGPHDSAGVLRDVAEIVNHLWGRDTPGGRCYGTLPAMAVRAVCLVPDGSRMVCGAHLLPGIPPVERVGRWMLIEAVEGDDLPPWRPDDDPTAYELTTYPTNVVWTGDTWAGALAAWRAYQAAGRQPPPAEWRDRLFLVRFDARTCEPCRSPEQFRALVPGERDRAGWHWALVRADHPGDAIALVMARLHPSRESTIGGRWPAPADWLGSHPTWWAASAALPS